MEHALHEPDEFETRSNVRWCRRCGRAIETLDGRELGGKKKPCQVVRIGFRDHSGQGCGPLASA